MKFSDLINKSKEMPQKTDKTLRGTGLTKRMAERSETKLEKQTLASLTDPTAKREAQEAVALMERAIADDIASIQTQAIPDNFAWDESQLIALDGLAAQRFGILIGSAGTGKTTVTRELVERLREQVGEIDLNTARMVTVNIGSDDHPVYERMPASQSAKHKKDMAPAIAFAAYTGIAMQQMKKALPEHYHKNCSTIHALLGYAPVMEEYVNEETGLLSERKIFRPSFTATNKLPYKIYIFDEAGMIPINLWNEFIAACPQGSRIYLIGDINQLPPVHGKGVLGYAMNKWPVYELTTIHRQAADNPIIANAHRILNGRIPTAVKGKFNIVDRHPNGGEFPGGGRGAAQVLLAVIKSLHKSGNFDPIKHTIIGAVNKGPLGREEINEQLVTYFNPEKQVNGIIVNKRMNIHTGTDHVLFATGDKIMVLQNDHARGLTNGMTGVIESINLNGNYDLKRSKFSEVDDEITLDLNPEHFHLDLDEAELEKEEAKEKESRDQRQASHVTTIKFSNGESVAFSTAGEYRKLTHAYMATCHKSQGSEYETVIIVCHSANAVMLRREWLYTAVTRARGRVILVCNDRGLMLATTKQAIKGNTLEEKIASYVAETTEFYDDADESDFDNMDLNKQPILWEAEEHEING